MGYYNGLAKICNECLEVKPATTEHFSPSKTGKFGVCSACKKCTAAIKRGDQLRRIKKEPVLEGYKVCSNCKVTKPKTLEFFHFTKQKGQLYSHCKACVSERSSKWAKENLEKKHARAKRHYDRNREKILKDVKEKRDKNPENHRAAVQRHKAKYPELTRQRNKDWGKQNPEKVKLKSARRRTAEGSFTTDDINALRDQQGNRCHWCGKKLGVKWHLDHRIPIFHGGTNYPSNLVLAHPSCNLKKGAKMPWEFMPGRLL